MKMDAFPEIDCPCETVQDCEQKALWEDCTDLDSKIFQNAFILWMSLNKLRLVSGCVSAVDPNCKAIQID